MKVKHLFNLEYVEWLDSVGYEEWHEPDKITDSGALIKSIGWVSHETPNTLTLTCHIDTENGHHSCDMRIVKCAITRRIVLKLAYGTKANKKRKA